MSATWPLEVTREDRSESQVRIVELSATSRRTDLFHAHTGVFPIELTLDHTVHMGRSAADVALLFEVLAGRDRLDPRQPAELRTERYTRRLRGDAQGLKIGIVKEGFG